MSVSPRSMSSIGKTLAAACSWRAVVAPVAEVAAVAAASVVAAVAWVLAAVGAAAAEVAAAVVLASASGSGSGSVVCGGVAVAAGTPAGGTAGVVAAHPGERVAGAESDAISGQKATFPCLWRISALPPKADIRIAHRHVGFGPQAEVARSIRSTRRRAVGDAAARRGRALWRSSN